MTIEALARAVDKQRRYPDEDYKEEIYALLTYWSQFNPYDDLGNDVVYCLLDKNELSVEDIENQLSKGREGIVW